MRDEFAGQRLPDLPNDGYSTRREKALSDEVMYFIRGCERNRRLLLKIIAGGKDRFRKIARKAWSHLRVDTELCDAVYASLVAAAFPTYALAHGERRDWDYAEIMRMASTGFAALVEYEDRTMAQRLQYEYNRLTQSVDRQIYIHKH